ncbi:MAG: DNA-directed RNA polymerase subunit alpha [Phycisphaerae bacterium]|nr:DNA-directed RNA polymerase subunit alpha [Phycisphaerae bacterium]
MDQVSELSSLQETETWDAAVVERIRQSAYSSGAQLENFRAWVGQSAAKGDRALNVKVGVAQCLLGRHDLALEPLKEGSEGALKRYFLGLVYCQRGQQGDAVTEFERAEARGWDAFQCAMATVEALRLAGKIDEAAKLLKKHAKAGESSADWHYQQGYLHELAGDLPEAGIAYTRATELNENHVGANFRLGYLHDIACEDVEAIRHYRRCVQTQPAPVHALINLAVLYEDQGNYDLAIRCVQEVLKVDPNHRRARLFLKDALAGLTQYYDEAQERARDKRTAVLEIPITDFELSVRSRNCLKKMNINTLGDLLNVTENELLSYKNFGETSLNEIKAVLAQKGLRLGQSLEDGHGDAPSRAQAGAANDVLARTVDELELSVRARRCLDRLGLRTLGDVASRTEAELMATKNFGVTSLQEIKRQLAAHGLSLRKLED